MEDGEESSEVCSKTAYEVPVATFWGSIKRSQKNVHDSFTKSQVMLLLCMWFGILNGSSHLTQIQHHILLLTRLKFIFDLCDRNESEMNKYGHKRTHTEIDSIQPKNSANRRTGWLEKKYSIRLFE